MPDEVEVTYEYNLECMDDSGEECYGLCDTDSQFCELTSLAPGRQHTISLYVCFKPDGNESVPVCGKTSEAMVDWTLPMRELFIHSLLWFMRYLNLSNILIKFQRPTV